MDEDYSKREIDGFIANIAGSLSRIEAQTINTNGRVTRIEKVILIATTAAVVYLVTKQSPLLDFITPFL